MVTATWATSSTTLWVLSSDISGIWNANFDGTDTKSKILSGMAGVLNVGLNIAGNLAAIYNLGFGTVKNGAEKAAITEFSATDLL